MYKISNTVGRHLIVPANFDIDTFPVILGKIDNGVQVVDLSDSGFTGRRSLDTRIQDAVVVSRDYETINLVTLGTKIILSAIKID